MMKDSLEDILGQSMRPLRLGAVQLDRLRRLTGHFNSVICWDGAGAVAAPAAAVLVIEVAHAPRIEALVNSLHENSIVILPFGENPAFDLLKSKLYAHGSLGAHAAEAPHHVWWGGVKPPAVRTGIYRKEDTLFISSFQRAGREADHADRLVGDLQRLGLNHTVMDISQEIGSARQNSPKVDFIVEQWTNTGRPVFWIDPHARLRGHPLLPQASGCDFAVHRQLNGAMTTGALFFRQTESAHALLDSWQRLTRSHPGLPESFLLDQAWTLATSQRQIETAWLPDAYWRTSEMKAQDGTIIRGRFVAGNDDQLLAPFAIPLQSGRRFGRHQAPEAHLVMKGAAGTRKPITVVIRDVLAASARDVAEAVEAAASAFAADAGGFSQMEIVLCGWNEDIESVLHIEDYSWVLMTDPSERLQANSFSSLSRLDANAGQRPAGHEWAGGLSSHEESVLALVDASLGARFMPGRQYRRSFIRRPDLALRQ
ncbi:hypothetical protein IVB30_23845 [Bradyrhizobium sp. 200]|uniref:hypothetical protein n=1 Tax=Bradyrhizobium sp. 200 TaxID=2782665 RepID=UPI001FFEA247|nr:hypothetical protein [Bradyrhizobium sp. 200]UPJ46381.1 hypothetical protein IVB30_23845 [Bradyrhizobium sp. 200]